VNPQIYYPLDDENLILLNSFLNNVIHIFSLKAKNNISRTMIKKQISTLQSSHNYLSSLNEDFLCSQVIEMSDELGLDEICCLQMLLMAHKYSDMSIESALGIFFEERSSTLLTLITLLQVAISLNNKFLTSYVNFLALYPGFLQRLVYLISDYTLLPLASSLHKIANIQQKVRATRSDLIWKEKKGLSEALFLLCHHSHYHIIKDMKRVEAVMELISFTIFNISKNKIIRYHNRLKHIVPISFLSLIELVTCQTNNTQAIDLNYLYRTCSFFGLINSINSSGYSSVAQLALGLLFLSSGDEDKTINIFRDAVKLRVFSYIRIMFFENLLCSNRDIVRETSAKTLHRLMSIILNNPLLQKIQQNYSLLKGKSFAERLSNIGEILSYKHSFSQVKDDYIYDALLMLAAVSYNIGCCCVLTAFDNSMYIEYKRALKQRWGYSLLINCDVDHLLLISILELLSSLAMKNFDCATRILMFLSSLTSNLSNIFTIIASVTYTLINKNKNLLITVKELESLVWLLNLITTVIQSIGQEGILVQNLLTSCRALSGLSLDDLLITMLNHLPIYCNKLRITIIRCLTCLVHQGSITRSLVMINQQLITTLFQTNIYKFTAKYSISSKIHIEGILEIFTKLKMLNKIFDLMGFHLKYSKNDNISAITKLQNMTAYAPFLSKLLKKIREANVNDISIELRFINHVLVHHITVIKILKYHIKRLWKPSSNSSIYTALHDIFSSHLVPSIALQILQIGIRAFLQARQAELYYKHIEKNMISALKVLIQYLEINEYIVCNLKELGAFDVIYSFFNAGYANLICLYEFFRYPNNELIQRHAIHLFLTILHDPKMLLFIKQNDIVHIFYQNCKLISSRIKHTVAQINKLSNPDLNICKIELDENIIIAERILIQLCNKEYMAHPLDLKINVFIIKFITLINLIKRSLPNTNDVILDFLDMCNKFIDIFFSSGVNRSILKINKLIEIVYVIFDISKSHEEVIEPGKIKVITEIFKFITSENFGCDKMFKDTNELYKKAIYEINKEILAYFSLASTTFFCKNHNFVRLKTFYETFKQPYFARFSKTKILIENITNNYEECFKSSLTNQNLSIQYRTIFLVKGCKLVKLNNIENIYTKIKVKNMSRALGIYIEDLSRFIADVFEQVIRPTGLLEPIIEVRESENQIDDLLEEIRIRIEKKERVLVTTLTKRMAEEFSKYLTLLLLAYVKFLLFLECLHPNEYSGI
jgi:hypothetical protein